MIPTFIRFPLAVIDAKFYADIYKIWFGLVGKIEAKFYADIWTEIGMSHNCVTMHNFHIYGPFTGRGEEGSMSYIVLSSLRKGITVTSSLYEISNDQLR